MKCEMRLPACAACGIRALPNDVQYNALQQPQLFSLDRSRVEGMPLQERAIRGIFHSMETNQFLSLASCISSSACERPTGVTDTTATAAAPPKAAALPDFYSWCCE